MTREQFDKLVEEAVEEIPSEFRERMENVAILVEDYPTGPIKARYKKSLLLGVFMGVPLTQQNWELAYPPHKVILYQKNIESICHSDEEIKQEVRITLIHEIGHFFGFNEVEIRQLQGLPPEPK